MTDDKKKPAAIFWDALENPELTHTCIGDAIGEWLEAQDCPLSELPDLLTVRGYARQELAEREMGLDAGCIVEGILETLDDEYGGEGNYNLPTEKQIAAAKVLVSAIREDYRPWACFEVESKTVNVREWIAENEPHLLEEVKT